MTDRPCLNCGKACTLQCSQCHSTYFCNQECQRAVWKAHKAFCKAVSKPELAPNPNKPPQTCLIVDGMGPLGAGEDYMKGAKFNFLTAGVNVIVVDANKGKKIPEQVAAFLESDSKPEAMIMLGWGSGEIPEAAAFAMNTTFREASLRWCEAGGRFIVQGERVQLVGNWPEWFGLSWKDGDYFRTDFKCFAAGTDAVHWCQWYKDAQGAITGRYNVKTCMLTDVLPSDTLFGSMEDSASYSLVPGFGGREIGEGSTSIAWSQYGSGTVSFFGDVNHEGPTLKVMAIVARGC